MASGRGETQRADEGCTFGLWLLVSFLLGWWLVGIFTKPRALDLVLLDPGLLLLLVQSLLLGSPQRTLILLLLESRLRHGESPVECPCRGAGPNWWPPLRCSGRDADESVKLARHLPECITHVDLGDLEAEVSCLSVNPSN